MSSHPSREYFVRSSKSWGRAISGPVFAVAAIVLAILAAYFSGNASMGVKIVRWSAWVLGGLAILMLFVAQYNVWREDHSKLTSVQLDLQKERESPNGPLVVAEYSFGENDNRNRPFVVRNKSVDMASSVAFRPLSGAGMTVTFDHLDLLEPNSAKEAYAS